MPCSRCFLNVGAYLCQRRSTGSLKGILGTSSVCHVAETCVTTWSGSFTRLGRKVGCLCPQGLAPPSAGYGPQTPKGSPLPGMLTSRPTEAINANMLIFPLRYPQTLQNMSVCDGSMQSCCILHMHKLCCACRLCTTVLCLAICLHNVQ